MNILFIVTELNSANGICTEAVMREFSSNGHSVYCITNNEPHNALSPDIAYSFVKPRLVYRLLAKRNKLLSFIGIILNKLKLILSYPTWPLISSRYAMRIYKKAEKICRENKIDVIVPIYTQIDTLIAAKKIKLKRPEIKYIPYFLDSLSGGYGPKCFSKSWVIRRGMKWESRLLTAADKIVMMKSSEEHYALYSKETDYYHKIIFLDLPLITPPKFSFPTQKSDSLIHLVYIGAIPVHIRNPEFFLQVFSKTDNPKYRLHIIGKDACSEMLSRYARNDSRIVIEGPVSHEEAEKRIADADITVNFGNNNSAMTPSKIFEYMSYGKPVISTMPIKNEPSAVYLKKYPLAYLVDYSDTDIEALAKNMQLWIDGVIGCRVSFATVEEIFKDNTPKSFLDIV